MKKLSQLKKQLKQKKQVPPALTNSDEKLVKEIRGETSLLNKNNLTRTKAYLDFYKRNPEIHWSFLAHMVSRNGGWNMTDLKGNLHSMLMDRRVRESFFSLLERSNWLIFQDAYPQLLLYEESSKRRKPLFHLLPALHVSHFMKCVWDFYWQENDPYMLTMALIVNEQNYLESRVVQHPVYQAVFSTVEFKMQDLLSMNHILFPYVEDGKTKLAGATVHQFERLHERILIGKRLYGILFGDRLNKVEKWAVSTPHTGSRNDYWPHLFNSVDEGMPGLPLKPRLISCKLTTGSPRFYSPKLEFSWKDRKHEKTEPGDWYKEPNILSYLEGSLESLGGEIEAEYCSTLTKLELAGVLGEVVE
ncbi:DUF2515 domain-containing protein [Bacillus sp. FJAT-27251]|uniref:DUF2515 domain-containing protein n=1 Tax=Bacillus sp. FJAT-27251 TaxID=1684142 RepID=UPI000B1A214D|nr:DUF2515 domain-containing protein [Bacillus sp. FJAT-27251]